jgi:hypothetical protein
MTPPPPAALGYERSPATISSTVSPPPAAPVVATNLAH